jgi:hypothetical protein
MAGNHRDARAADPAEASRCVAAGASCDLPAIDDGSVVGLDRRAAHGSGLAPGWIAIRALATGDRPGIGEATAA